MSETPAQHAEYVRVDMAALRGRLCAHFVSNAKASTYGQGWNDALYFVLDELERAELIDGSTATSEGGTSSE